MNDQPDQPIQRPARVGTSHIVERWQRAYLDRNSAALAVVADLRRGHVEDLSASPRSWPWLFDAMPESGSDSGSPTRDERAAHTAVTLWARHQQGLSQPASVRGVSLGRAASILSDRLKRPDEHVDSGVQRRLNAVQAASSYGSRARALAQLLSMMRAQDVCLDFPRLADDLVKLQSPRDDVRRSVLIRWARDFRRIPTSKSTTANPTPKES